MKNYLTFLYKNLSIGIAMGILVLPAQATNENLYLRGQNSKDIHPWGQRIIEIIRTQSQAALCKEGGIFRERNNMLSKPGEKCKNKDLAEIAITMCVSDDFKKSKCYFNAGTMLGSAGINAAPTNVEEGVKFRHINIYGILCHPQVRPKLEGIAAAIAIRSCDDKAPARPSKAAPVMTAAEKQKIKRILQRDIQTLETLGEWVLAKPTTQRGNLSIGSQRGTTPFKIRTPTDPSQQRSLLTAAQNLTNALKNLNVSLDSPKAPPINPEIVNVLNEFIPRITEESSISEMLKRLDEMQHHLDQIK